MSSFLWFMLALFECCANTGKNARVGGTGGSEGGSVGFSLFLASLRASRVCDIHYVDGSWVYTIGELRCTKRS